MTVMDDTSSDSGEQVSPRLQQFTTDIEKIQVTGGRANRERLGLVAGMVLFVAALVVEVVAFVTSSGATDPRDQTDMVVLALLGVVLALGSVALFVRYALTRWFRYWLVRLIYEDREQTDRLIAVLSRK